jgi:heterodisulfide reductase subunit A-like polyferredoxin
MDMSQTTIVLCSCEDTMSPDAKTVGKACQGATIRTASHLCRTETSLFADLAAKDGKLIIGCTQEAPLFQDLAEDNGLNASLTFVNIRETAGWSKEGKKTGPKMAALIAAATIGMSPVTPVTLQSNGVVLILGRDQTAVDVSAKLAGRMDVTVILQSLDGIMPPRSAEFPIRQGRARTASGWLGAF